MDNAEGKSEGREMTKEGKRKMAMAKARTTEREVRKVMEREKTNRG